MNKEDILQRYMVDGKPWLKMRMTRFVSIMDKQEQTDENVAKAHAFLSEFPETAYVGLLVTDIGKPYQLISNWKGWHLINFTLEGRAFEVMKYARFSEKITKRMKGYKGGKRRVWNKVIRQRVFDDHEETWSTGVYLKDIQDHVR